MKYTQPIIWSSPDDSLEALAQGLDQVMAENARSIMILAASNNFYDEARVKDLLKNCCLPICGGLFPQIIHNQEVMSSGAVVIGFDFELTIFNFTELSKHSDRIDAYIGTQSKAIAKHENFAIFADALCANNENFIDQFYEYIGSGISVIGGGAGFLDFVSRPCLFSNDGLVADAVQLVGIPTSLSKSIGHGWEICDGPYLVTAADGHNLQTLNYQPAFELYQSTIKKISGQEINDSNFFEIAKNFPLGIVDLNGELLVRDPITTDLKNLECVGNVPTNATINLLKGDQKKLIASAKEAATNLTPKEDAQLLLLFDCISRVLYLQEEFSKEVAALQTANPDLPMVGVLSLGEIASTKSNAVHFLNKSTVIGMF